MAERGKPVKLGLIGCGQVTETRHLPALQLFPNAEVVAVADINPDRLKRVADRFHIEHRYSDFRALLDVPAIEAVAVCVPPQFHAEVALAALDAGKHLLIEKPLTLCLDQSDELIERAARSPRKVTVGFNLRWHRLVRHAREIIRGGILGPLKSVRTVLTSGRRYQETGSDWRKRRELGGGVLFEVAIHHFDLWRFLLQSEVEEVFATSRSEAKRKRAQELGADAVFDSTGFSAAVRQATGDGVDVVFEHVGPATMGESMRSLALGGRIVTCGSTSGLKAEISMPRLFFRHASLLGSTMGNASEFEAVLKAIDRGLRPVVDSVYPLSDVVAALTRLDAAEQFGKVVLSVSS